MFMKKLPNLTYVINVTKLSGQELISNVTSNIAMKVRLDTVLKFLTLKDNSTRLEILSRPKVPPETQKEHSKLLMSSQ